MNDYPTDEEITQVRTWTFDEPGSFDSFMAYVKSIGNYWPTDSFGWACEDNIYRISTGGWSGNEEIIDAMRENWTFWSVCWHESHRGGHYVFVLPDPSTYFRKDLS